MRTVGAAAHPPANAVESADVREDVTGDKRTDEGQSSETGFGTGTRTALTTPFTISTSIPGGLGVTPVSLLQAQVVRTVKGQDSMLEVFGGGINVTAYVVFGVSPVTSASAVYVGFVATKLYVNLRSDGPVGPSTRI
jgi:hypothetical protein